MRRGHIGQPPDPQDLQQGGAQPPHAMFFPLVVPGLRLCTRHATDVEGRKNREFRLIWDGSTKLFLFWWECTMNEATSMENELEITFGGVLVQYCTWIWNLRISFSQEEIWLAFVDISACLHYYYYPRVASQIILFVDCILSFSTKGKNGVLIHLSATAPPQKKNRPERTLPRASSQ